MLEAADRQEVELVTSTISIVEVFHAEHERIQYDPNVTKEIALLWHPAASPIRLVDAHELLAKEALDLLRKGVEQGWFKTKGNDAIHLVTARSEFCTELLTTENAMSKWQPLIGVKICQPHLPPTKIAEEKEAEDLFTRPAGTGDSK